MSEHTDPQDYPSITLGGGCFWCLEAVFERVHGVKSVVSGYSGGKAGNADYRTVCSGTTGHAEVVRVFYDPKEISLAELLEIFWTTHDPTTLNRQGNDVGPQYRSVIFYQGEEEKELAERSLREVATPLYENAVVTQIEPLTGFWPAEAEHQGYYRKVGNRNPYCTFVINPKVAKLKKKFASKLKPAYQ